MNSVNRESPDIMGIAMLPPPPRQTANPAPVRPARSVRRSCSIDIAWPEGPQGDRLVIGRARDYLTPSAGHPGKLLAQARMQATLAEDKTILSISASPEPDRLQELVGKRAGGHLRLALGEIMPGLIEQGAPLYLALDDISGTALVSPFAWSQWHPDWVEYIRASMPQEEIDRMRAARVNVCWGLQEGNSGVGAEDEIEIAADADAGDLRNPEDPEGWHDLPDQEGPGFRRARRIDVTRDEAAGVIRIDAAFQDSATRMQEGRIAIHEYRLVATADMNTLELLTLEPEARILPYPECPGAVGNTQRLIGLPIADIRANVLTQLRGPQGCTHLNDALRALAEVPKLAAYLEGV